jgi:site-specific DNA-methyltransferase (adenine-specific)
VTEPRLVWLDPDELVPHPNNPRIGMREDVIDRIAIEIAHSGFGVQHAITARPFEGSHQIIAGHHRVDAARKAKSKVAAWVTEMTDDEAFMQLILSNSQGELTPLEEGWHLYENDHRMVNAGRGQTGGIRDYARRLGKDEKSLRERRDAYRVFGKCGHMPALSGEFRTLYAISRAPEGAWQTLVERLVDHQWTVADVLQHVSAISEFTVPAEHRDWLHPDALTAAYLADYRFKASTVTDLIHTADSVTAWINANGSFEHHTEFRRWLICNSGGESWRRRAIMEWHAALIQRLAEEAEPAGPDIRAGDFREVLADVADGSVSLILTDPPYGDESVTNYADVAAFAARVLKPGGSLICYAGQATLPEVLTAMTEHLRYWWTLALEHNHGGQQLPGKWVMVEWKPVIWMVKDHREGRLYVADRIRGTQPDKISHEWAQGVEEVFYLIEQLTAPGDLICDPFAGSGAFGKAALELSRRFVGADVDPGSAVGQVVA